SVEYSVSGWTDQSLYVLKKGMLRVIHLNGALKTCLVNAGYTDINPLHVFTKLDCRNSSLQNSDILQIEDFTNLQSLIIDNNPAVTDISPLANLPYLSLLSMEGNSNINLDLTGLTELKDLYLGNMALSSLPDLSTNASLEFLDISNNQIASGFTQLPASLTVLVLDNNDISSCEGLAGKTIETISLAGENVTDTTNCTGIIDLQNLNIKNASNLTGEYNIDDEAGFCSLILNNTGITSITGSRPVNVLSLTNNVDLKENHLIKLAWNSPFDPIYSYPDLIPMRVDISGSNDTLCGNDDKNKLLWNSNTITDMSQPFSTTVNDDMKDSPLCYSRIAPAYISPDICKPDPTPFKVYTDDTNSKRFITWDNNANALNWGILYYKIFGTVNGEAFSYNTVNTDETELKQLHSLTPDSYEIIACTAQKCGYSAIVTEDQFEIGLTTVSGAIANYANPISSPQTFKVEFDYNSNGASLEARPTRFEISSDMDETFSVIISCIGTCSDTGHYASIDLDNGSILGSQLNIQACNDVLGCGAKKAINITPSIASADIPVPAWTINGHSIGSIVLKWNLPAGTTDEEVGNIDYFEITEWKPMGIESGAYPGSLSSLLRSDTRFYIENDKDLAVTTERSVRLNRVVNGYYDYNIRACQRNRTSIDVCSDFAGGIYETTYIQPGQTEEQLKNCRPNEPLPNWGVENCEKGHHLTYDFYIQPLALASSTVIESPYWYADDDGKYHISWESNDHLNHDKMDYFYLTQLSAESNAENQCNLGDNKLNLRLKVNFADLKHIANNKKAWDTIKYCNDLGIDTKWSIQACRLGHGCSDEVIIDLNETTQQGANSQWQSPSSSTTPGASALGGPDDFLPGMWWNPALGGTGWHFYWASELRYASTHNNYGNTHDLIGYWFAYKQDKTRGIWTPTWFETRLKRLDSISEELGLDHTGCFEGDILSNNHDNNPASQINVGNLQVCFKDGDNQNATLIFDINRANDILSQGSDVANMGPYESLADGRLKLEINDFAIGIIGDTGSISQENDDDHYSGLWQNSSDTQPYADISLLTWLERGLEVSTLAIYDDAGDPIWFQAVNCGGTTTVSCTPSGAGYFDDYHAGPRPGQTANTDTLMAIAQGFNPIAARPEGFAYDNVIANGGVFFYGKMGRCLNTDLDTASNNTRFRDATIWYDINYTMYSEDPLINNRTVSSPTMGVQNCSSGVQLKKTASLHDIRFFINDNDETMTSCDPNDPEQANYCQITFQWFTDDDFPNIEPYYSTDNGTSYAKLSTLCQDAIPLGEYAVPEFICNLTEHPGDYKFQLHKNKHGSTTGETIAIAESQPLTIIACNGQCSLPTDPPVIDEVGDAPLDPINNRFNHQVGAGPIPGSGGVSGGAATYNLPLSIPPGRNGMTPSVSVNYSSKGGNGTLGIGWSISAGSSIYRCPQSLAQDGNNHAVNFSNADRLCLDGQRLMLVDATLPTDPSALSDPAHPDNTAYWAIDAQYSTEQDSFARITQSAAGFTVKTKSGRTNTYEQKGMQDTVWQLVKEMDSFKNNIKYSYTNSDGAVTFGTNEWLLSEIAYTGLDDSDGNRTIAFTYIDRMKLSCVRLPPLQ
ncbi:MAG: hypothetical protein JKY19_03895, partial [Alcanivoracaceae bacterium]|nr:hypothetical protein [Alcanivoracaceae bacterium]